MSKPAATPLRGILRENESLARHTSWRVGGVASRFYLPADINDLSAFLQQLPGDEPLAWIGLGSNLLVRDGGYAGTVICTNGVLNGMDFPAGDQVLVEAGVACPKVARQSARQGLQGAEFLCGIPGTIGGALAMNAGAFGGETWDIVAAVTTVDRQGQLHERTAADYVLGYRQCEGPTDEWFVAARLQLSAGDAETSLARIKELLNRRGSSQPTQQPNAGSVFRNPPGDHAARLIESCGLKGTCIGGACVSERHANFIVNDGTASAADIEQLIEQVKTTVQQVHGIVLQREVHIIGETQPVTEGSDAH